MTRTLHYLLALVLLIAVAFAVTATTDATTETEDINVGQVTGTHGSEDSKHELSQGSGDSLNIRVWSFYGFHCSKKTCQGQHNPPFCANQLTITFTRQQGEDEPLAVWSRTSISHKEAKQNTKDWDCPQGPPRWNASGSVEISDPGPGTPGEGGGGGDFDEAFEHTVHPQTSWYKAWTQTNPVPVDSQGDSYELEASEIEQWQWEYDENNPSTNTFVVAAEVLTTFSGSAVEIEVVECWMKAKCELEAHCSVAEE